MSRRPARVTQADIGRALRAAEKAGPHVAVDILPDGTIRLTRPGVTAPLESGTSEPQRIIAL